MLQGHRSDRTVSSVYLVLCYGRTPLLEDWTARVTTLAGSLDLSSNYMLQQMQRLFEGHRFVDACSQELTDRNAH
ncbi:hypothetical protein vseg_013852 [Gypsophila vaccaria]